MKRGKVVFISTPALGNIVPIIEFAKLFTPKNKNISATILLINIPQRPLVQSYIDSLTTTTTTATGNIHFLSLPVADPPSLDQFDATIGFLSLLIQNHTLQVKNALIDLISDSDSGQVVGFFIDMFCTSFIDVAKELNIPCYLYFASPATFLSFMLHLPILDAQVSTNIEYKDSANDFNILGFSNPVPIKCFPSFMLKRHIDGYSWFLHHAKRYKETKGIIVNTFQELEPYCLNSLVHTTSHVVGEKDAIGNASMLIEPRLEYKEFSAAEIRTATDGFSNLMRLKSGGDWTDVYKAKLHHTSVAIKLYSSADVDSEDTFQAKVKFLSHMRHPHILSMIGYCSELRCIVFEYMHNGCLRDILFSGTRGSKRRNNGLNWQARICIVANVCTGLCFLHHAKPTPVAHGNLNPSKILLDHNNMAKIHGVRTPLSCDRSDMRSDIRAYGNLVLQILTGRNWAGLVEEAIMMDQSKLIEVLDRMAGEWPLDIALELGRIGIKCLSVHEDKELNMSNLAREMEKVKKLADEIVANGRNLDDHEGSTEFPNFFLCPILQEVMKNPHVAADGFSYELEAIEEWLKNGRDTSPMTNLRLKDNILTPNHSLRALIQDSQKKQSTSTR